MQTAKVIHWSEAHTRVLTHFYAFCTHASTRVNNYHKRLIRDKLHYNDEMYCKASQILTLLRAESPDGSFSSMHIRRGDFQFSEVNNMPIEHIMDSAKEYLKPGELIYISTDHKDKTFFKPMQELYAVRFLDDYFDRAKVDELKGKNAIGMIESIVSSHGRTFTGTWWSTFTAYIMRLRGYNGLSKKTTYYAYTERKYFAHSDDPPERPYWISGMLYSLHTLLAYISSYA
jgi:GDP-fucose protein O-fucosyltransferase